MRAAKVANDYVSSSYADADINYETYKNSHELLTTKAL